MINTATYSTQLTLTYRAVTLLSSLKEMKNYRCKSTIRSSVKEMKNGNLLKCYAYIKVLCNSFIWLGMLVAAIIVVYSKSKLV